MPPHERIADVLVLAPVELVASKVMAYHNRKGQPNAFTDLRDIAVLLLAFPNLKSASGPVRIRLCEMNPDAALLSTWDEIVANPISVDEDEDTRQ